MNFFLFKQFAFRYKIVLDSDAKSFDGHGRVNNQQEFFSENIMWDNRQFSFPVNFIPKLSSQTIVLSLLLDLSSNTNCTRSCFSWLEPFCYLKINYSYFVMFVFKQKIIKCLIAIVNTSDYYCRNNYDRYLEPVNGSFFFSIWLHFWITENRVNYDIVHESHYF